LANNLIHILHHNIYLVMSYIFSEMRSISFSPGSNFPKGPWSSPWMVQLFKVIFVAFLLCLLDVYLLYFTDLPNIYVFAKPFQNNFPVIYNWNYIKSFLVLFMVCILYEHCYTYLTYLKTYITEIPNKKTFP